MKTKLDEKNVGLDNKILTDLVINLEFQIRELRDVLCQVIFDSGLQKHTSTENLKKLVSPNSLLAKLAKKELKNREKRKATIDEKLWGWHRLPLEIHGRRLPKRSCPVGAYGIAHTLPPLRSGEKKEECSPDSHRILQHPENRRYLNMGFLAQRPEKGHSRVMGSFKQRKSW